QGPRKDDICYATQNRQDAVKELTSRCEVLLVVGSANSSNSNRLRELAERRGIPAYLIDNAEDIRPEWLTGKQRVGLTAGASAPEVLVDQVIERLQEWGAEAVTKGNGHGEAVTFSLPKELKD
ncbi:MAG TPA: 4-hydroxy-3-methylbut-2-enyl diphosphate reductase, partial [Chromatiales bacterium]|nr:4-hydroxy-3-methylbut-2-enyl diphosphate reductase [Chromatiales bacterium]